jgi:hypothetical protein
MVRNDEEQPAIFGGGKERMEDARKFSETPTISTMATREKQKTRRMDDNDINTNSNDNDNR